MFWLLLLLLFAGLFLVLLEVIIPFGISFISGLIVIGLAMYLGYQQFEAGERIFYLSTALVLAAMAAYVAQRSGIKWLTLRQPKANPDEAPPPANNQPRPTVGEIAEVVQPLRPTGTILWQQQRFPARTLRPEIESHLGDRVEIKGVDSIYYMTEPATIAPPG